MQGDLVEVLQYTQEIKDFLDISDQVHYNAKEEITDVELIKRELQLILSHLKTNKKRKGDEVEVLSDTKRTKQDSVYTVAAYQVLVETVIKALKEQLVGMLTVASFTFLSMASSTIHKICLPLVSNFSLSLPADGVLRFRHIVPKTIRLEDNLPEEFPPSVTRLDFTFDFNYKIRALPDTITHITFGYYFNQDVDHLLPASLTFLEFGNNFNQTIDHLPHKLTHLILRGQFDKPVPHLPKSITHLTFSYYFRHTLENPPPGLQQLLLRHQFKHSIDHLPDSITSLTTHTTAKINKLPASLTELNLYNAGGNITCNLPSSLTKLYISGSHIPDLSALPLVELHVGITQQASHPLQLPKTLKKLNIFGVWNGPIHTLPPNLLQLTINSRIFSTPLDGLPPLLTHLELGFSSSEFSHPFKVIPKTVSSLIIHRQLTDRSQLLNLPPNISYLELGDLINLDINHILPKITTLTLGAEFDTNVSHLPPLTHLVFGSVFNLAVDTLPATLETLVFGFHFDQPVNHLPPHLKELTFGYAFNQKANKLPASITHLSFGYSFNQHINELPASLLYLYLGVMFSKPIYNLPSDLYLIDMAFFYRTSHSTPINEALPRFPRSLRVFYATLILDYGQNNGINTNYDEFTESADAVPIDDCYAWRTTCNFYRKLYVLECFTSKNFYDRFIGSCPATD